MVIALAGRRIDAAGAAPARFPPENMRLVEERLRRLLESETVSAVVSSAACGADLMAQSIAETLGLRRRVVLPFDRFRFRGTSVTDRGGDWGPAYDRLLNELDATGDVVTVGTGGEGTAAYATVNLAILDQATAMGAESGQEVLAVVVWEGASRGSDDLTAAFGQEARKRGLRVEQVLTL
jgi:hypothetical protein